MKEPNLVSECINEMVNSCSIPVTAKTRIGFDNTEDFDYLNKFILKMYEAGCKTFIIHARKAILKGLTPKQNLNIPKLNYEMVYKIKKENPDMEIIINGGISSIDQIKNQAEKNGVEKTKSEAQTLVTAAVTLAQNEWDGLSDEQKEIRGPRPTAITIP